MQVSSAVLQLREPRPTVNGAIAIIALDRLELTAFRAARDVFGNDERDRGVGGVENSGKLLDARNVVEHTGAVSALDTTNRLQVIRRRRNRRHAGKCASLTGAGMIRAARHCHGVDVVMGAERSGVL